MPVKTKRSTAYSASIHHPAKARPKIRQRIDWRSTHFKRTIKGKDVDNRWMLLAALSPYWQNDVFVRTKVLLPLSSTAKISTERFATSFGTVTCP
jgi:hypothetical protein